MNLRFFIICSSILAFCIFTFPVSTSGKAVLQEDSVIEKKIYKTLKISDAPPLIDGQLNDDVWNSVEWGGDFIQFQPDEGKAPAQKTSFKILYDDKNIYVAVKCFDTEPDKIVRRMGRRDNYDGDWVQMVFDSYFDHLTAFGFMVTASGVIGDEYITNDFQNEDLSWDPIWYVKTSLDDEGWNAEMRIPLSQLRFPERDEQVWGLEIMRRDHRKGEMSMWQYIKKNSPGFVHRFGELHGLLGLKPQKQLEIMPYVLSKIESSEKVDGNPFATGSRQVLNAGLDGKIGITSNFTLDFTINPDFGQVEADPSIVNLTGFQNYFSERRPFFIESNNILDYRISESIAWGSHNSDNLFYSRRIGHNPQGYPELGNNEYARIPENTTILGALKLTGKTQDGLSVGVLESLTQREIANISDGANERSEAVEPLTNYFETRIIKDYNKGNTQIGGIVTSVNRDLRDPELDFMRRSAYSGGLDFNHNWKNKTWYLNGNVIFSRVEGSAEAITNTQTSQEHLFQRPGSGYIKVDTTLTSLSGSGATVRFGRGGNGKVQFQLGGTYRSPGIELNDIGYLYKANALYQFFWASYHLYNPWWILNRFQCNINQWTHWDLTGNHLYRAANYNMHWQFKNFYSFGGGVTWIPYRLENDALRGGPALMYPANIEGFAYASSDYRKKLNIELFFEWSRGSFNFYEVNGVNLWLRYQPLNYLSFSISPGFNANRNHLQYITEIGNNGQPAYILGKINQTTTNFTARVNISIRPNLTIQYYGQPFLSKGEYDGFKKVTIANAEDYNDRFHLFTANEISLDETNNLYNVDENTDGVMDFSFDNPDFDFVQFRSNMVVRWEYKPGSTLFLVWTQARTGDALLQDHSIGNLSENLIDIYPNNVFLLKVSYRFIK